jgi:hypothetical protein
MGVMHHPQPPMGEQHVVAPTTSRPARLLGIASQGRSSMPMHLGQPWEAECITPPSPQAHPPAVLQEGRIRPPPAMLGTCR